MLSLKAKMMSAKGSVCSVPEDHSTKTEKAMPALAGMLAERIQIEATEEMDRLAKVSNNLYNEVNCRMRQQFFKTGIVLSYFELCKESEYQ